MRKVLSVSYTLSDDGEMACFLVGKFMFFFAQMEYHVNEAILRTMKLHTDEGYFLVSLVPLQKKVRLLKLLTNKAVELFAPSGDDDWPERSENTFKTISKIISFRNNLAHTRFTSIEEGGVAFIPQRNHDRSEPIEPTSRETMERMIRDAADLQVGLMNIAVYTADLPKMADALKDYIEGGGLRDDAAAFENGEISFLQMLKRAEPAALRKKARNE